MCLCGLAGVDELPIGDIEGLCTNTSTTTPPVNSAIES